MTLLRVLGPLVLCLALGGFHTRVAAAQVLDALVARIDDGVITWSLVVQERELRRVGGAPEVELGDAAVLDALVRRRLLVAEAKKLRLEVGVDEAREDVEYLVRAAGGERFWARVAKLGLDRRQLEERAARQILVRRYLDLRREMTFVPESEVRAVFRDQGAAARQRVLAEVRDEIRAQLAETKYREELARWIKRQVAEGRVELMPLPATG